ncbi:MAG: sensor histidine kinase YesM [Saprospiraceae bacterium]|jgi:sensor histidine kinase YesM
MQQFLKKTQHLLLTNNIWIFLAAIFFSSNIALYNCDEQTWGNYWTLIFKTSLAFSPVLLLVVFRDWLSQRIPRLAIIGLWVYCFLLHPQLVKFLFAKVASTMVELGIGMVAIQTTALLFIVAEMGIQVSKYGQKNQHIKRWTTKISLEKVIWSSMVLFAIAYFTFGYIRGADVQFTIGSFVSTVFQIFLIIIPYYAFYYINHYFLVNKLLKQKGLIFYIFGFFATIIFLYPIAAQFIAFIPLVKNGDIHPVSSAGIFSEINFLVPFFGMLMSIPFIMIVRWFRQSKELANLAAEKSETELNLIKQQINPHFFFNTLNNLYALSLTKGEQTPEVILQLSELMRYVIYKGKEKHVFLKEEVKYIEDYIQLQQIRLAKKLDFKFEKNIEDEHLKIPPLLFITFVENAFKHGVEPAENDCFLHLSLKTEGNQLVFVCKNSVEEQLKEPAGIGLENLKRRLELRFPKAHYIEIEEGKNEFITTLKIKLN